MMEAFGEEPSWRACSGLAFCAAFDGVAADKVASLHELLSGSFIVLVPCRTGLCLADPRASIAPLGSFRFRRRSFTRSSLVAGFRRTQFFRSVPLCARAIAPHSTGRSDVGAKSSSGDS